MERQRIEYVVKVRDRNGVRHNVVIAGARAKMSIGYVRTRCMQIIPWQCLELWFSNEYPFTNDCIEEVIKEYTTYKMPDKQFFDTATKTTEKRVKVQI